MIIIVLKTSVNLCRNYRQFLIFYKKENTYAAVVDDFNINYK